MQRSLGRRFWVLIAAIVMMLGVTMTPSILFASSKFPWIRQKSDTDCGRAALATLIAGLRGGDVNEIYARIRPPKNSSTGYAIEELISVSANLGAPLRIRLSRESPEPVVILGQCAAYPDYFRSLHRMVADGFPVIVPTKPKGKPNHYLVLIQSDGRNFTVLNPADPKQEIMSTERLSTIMCPLGYQVLSSAFF